MTTNPKQKTFRKELQRLVSEAYYSGADHGEEAGEVNTEYEIADQIEQLFLDVIGDYDKYGRFESPNKKETKIMRWTCNVVLKELIAKIKGEE